MMKKHLLMSWVFCSMLQVVACGQEKAQKVNISVEKAKIGLINKLSNYDKLPVRYKTTKEQWENTDYEKVYGVNKLKQISPFIYSFVDDEQSIERRSEVENVVLIINRKADRGNKVEFYNQSKIIKSILIDTLNPYKNLASNGIDLSHLEGKLMLNRFKDKKAIDKKIAYYTTRWTHYSSQNQFTTIAFSLESRNKDGIPIKWEESLFVFSQQGKIMLKTKVNNDITDFYVAENLEHYGYTFGGLNSEDFEADKNAIFRLYKLNSQKQIFQSDTEHSLSGFYELVPNLIQLNVENNQKDNFSYQVLDLDNNSMLSLFEDYNEEKKFIDNNNRNMINYLKNSKLTNLKFIENEK